MPSPFPGMNPYLEQPDAWSDFHLAFVPALRNELVAQLFPRYLVKLEERLYVHELPESDRRYFGRSDVSVAAPLDTTNSSGLATIAAPFHGRLADAVDFEKVPYIEIRDRTGRELVTVIELLSPANKLPGPDRQQYLAKRNQYLHSRVHLVEIDLLRGGPRMPVEGLKPCDYCVLVSRFETRPDVGLWFLGLRGPLPQIPIPLTGDDAPARVDLQLLLNRVYDSAGYASYIYEGSPEPPLNSEDAVWAQGALGSQANVV
jgi:Protein of unknown function (DUF4058)